MPLYDFSCNQCQRIQSVLVTYAEKKNLELICVDCGGTMKAMEIHHFTIISSGSGNLPAAISPKAKSCGHKYHCQCAAIRNKKPNPFQKQVDEALYGNCQTQT